MDKDVAGLVERLEAYVLDQLGWYNIGDTCEDAASTIRALVAEIERLRDLADKYKWQVRDTCARAEAAEAKLREAVEVMRNVCEAWEWWNVDTYDRCSGVPDDAVRSARAFLATMEKAP